MASLKPFRGSFCLLPSPHHKVDAWEQDASTDKLFVSPMHGWPNVAFDTLMLQLLRPMQACETRVQKHKSHYDEGEARRCVLEVSWVRVPSVELKELCGCRTAHG